LSKDSLEDIKTKIRGLIADLKAKGYEVTDYNIDQETSSSRLNWIWQSLVLKNSQTKGKR
jgi:hypothetical protein